jgi:hypothetical protein
MPLLLSYETIEAFGGRTINSLNKFYNPLVEIAPTGPGEWKVLEWAAPFLISAVTTREAASAMENKEAAQQIIATAEIAISQFLDDYCGTPPRLVPWPFPGPAPWIAVIASQVAMAANSLHGGSLQAALTKLSGRILDRVALNPQPLPPQQ